MTVAVSKALEEGATRGRVRLHRQHLGVRRRLLRPRRDAARGRPARGRDRPRQARPGPDRGARVIAVQGDFDDALGLVRELVERHDVALLNSVNPYRLEGQKTAAFEVVEQLGGAPDWLALPVGNGGNITAYWKGFGEIGRRRRACSPARPRAPPRCSRAAGRAPRDGGDRDPDRQPGPARRGAGRRVGVGRRRAGDARRRDPDGLPAARPGGGRVLRAGVGGIGRRRCSRRPPTAWWSRGRRWSACSPGTA